MLLKVDPRREGGAGEALPYVRVAALRLQQCVDRPFSLYPLANSFGAREKPRNIYVRSIDDTYRGGDSSKIRIHRTARGNLRQRDITY